MNCHSNIIISTGDFMNISNIIQRRQNGIWARGQGNHGNRRKGKYIEKGKKGFLSRPVVIISPNGSCKHMGSVGEAQVFLGLRNRQQVTRAIRKGYVKHGFRLIYEEDLSPRADYSFKTPELRDDNGRSLPEQLRLYRRRQELYMTDKQREERSRRARECAFRQANDPNNRWGKGGRSIPIYCVTNNKRYNSIKEASIDLCIPYNQIVLAMHRNGTAHGYKFYRQDAWDNAGRNIQKIISSKF